MAITPLGKGPRRLSLRMAIPVMVEEAIGGLNFGMVEALNLKVVNLIALRQVQP